METTFVSAEFLTPTFITDPTTYSVYCDLYISKGNTSHAYILDSNKLLKAIVEKTGLSIPGAIRTLTECSLFKHKK